MNDYSQDFTEDQAPYPVMSLGQSAYTTFSVPLSASSGTAASSGTTVTYYVSTGTSYSAGQANIGSAIVSATEADLADIAESDRAMADARQHGTKPWSRLRKELGL